MEVCRGFYIPRRKAWAFHPLHPHFCKHRYAVVTFVALSRLTANTDTENTEVPPRSFVF